MRVAVVGPVGAGKTVYLASLLLAGFAEGASRAKVRPEATSEATLALQGRAHRVLAGETLPATTTTTTYDLVADLPGSVLFGLGAESVSIGLVDPPGGECLPPPQRPPHPKVLDGAAPAEGLLLVLAARKQPPALVERLRGFTAAVRQRKGVERAPFVRTAVVLTMSELLVPAGPGAADALDQLEPQATATALLGAELMGAIEQLSPRGGHGYALVSAFGFDRTTRAPAADLQRHRLHGRHVDAWQPYRLFEPIEFLARGFAWREAWS